MASPRMLSRVPPPTGARLPVGASVPGRPGVFQSPQGSASPYTMNAGIPPRSFAPIPGMAPAAPPVAAAPVAPPAPGTPGPDGSIDLLAYGRANGITAPGRNFDETANHPGGVDMLAWGPDNGVLRPGATTGLTPAQQPPPALATQPAPAVPPPPPPPPQTERVNPLTGDNSKVVPGQSTSFTPPPPVHVGGEGSYMRSFSNPTSAGIYDSYVKNLFGSNTPNRAGKSPLSRSPAQPAYDGM